jgi:formylglycine-generating enzyme required for sulfatase activity
VSHSHYDNPFAEKFCDTLKQKLPNSDIFLDLSDIRGGDEWAERIQREVLDRPILVVLLSLQSVNAAWVRQETTLALTRAVTDKTRRVIPVRIDRAVSRSDIDQLAPLLNLRQVIDIQDGAPHTRWTELIRVIRGEVPELVDGDADVVKKLERALDYANRVHEAFLAEHWRDAEITARFAVTLPPNDGDATLWSEYGVALSHMDGKTDEALSKLTKAISINERRSDLYQKRAQILAKQGDVESAIADWDNAYNRSDDDSEKLEILFEKYDELRKAKKWNEAIDTTKLALEKSTTESQKQLWTERQATVHDEMVPLEHFPRSLRKLGFQFFVSATDLDYIIPPMCEIPDGEFTMGSDLEADESSDPDETPAHKIPTGGFEIAKYPVTVAEYSCAVRAQMLPEPAAADEAAGKALSWKAQQSERMDHPIVNVSWHHAVLYAYWLSQMTGDLWRLPTEAEWEKAARGADSRKYPWGDDWDRSLAHLLANTKESGVGMTAPVGSYPQGESPYHVQDMAGNVLEWTNTIMRPYPYKATDGRENSQDTSSNRVLRGGSWRDLHQEARVSQRKDNIPSLIHFKRGFRLVRAMRSGSR